MGGGGQKNKKQTHKILASKSSQNLFGQMRHLAHIENIFGVGLFGLATTLKRLFMFAVSFLCTFASIMHTYSVHIHAHIIKIYLFIILLLELLTGYARNSSCRRF